jgi:ATP-dependent Clp protease ATP-binding subunit ClpC
MANEPAIPLSTGAQRLIERGEAKREQLGQQPLGLHHHLLALLELFGPLAVDLVPGLDGARYRREVEARVQAGDVGPALDQTTLANAAAEHARQQGKLRAYESDVVAVLLDRAGLEVAEPTAVLTTTPAAGGSTTAPTAGGSATAPITGGSTPAPVAGSGYRPRTRRPTPNLERYGRDLTAQAAAGQLPPLIDRAAELQAVIETLCRRTKRNPVLVGPAGTGKTAIVEGLAQRIVAGQVPEPLRQSRLFAIQLSSLLAGAGTYGALEERLEAVLAEARQDGVLLFLDEVHSIVGAGGARGSTDLASLLKPTLARGDLACLAATTDDEYRRYIEPDGALERRFQPIRVNQLGRAETRQVLESLSLLAELERGVRLEPGSLDRIVDLADRLLKNRYFPDKAVDIFDQSVAAALAQGASAVGPALVEQVVQRMVGMPLDWTARLATLPANLAALGLLDQEAGEALASRLKLTVEGLDIRPQRANAVLLLVGQREPEADPLARALAEALLGSAERVLAIDLSSFTHPADVSRLIGSPPGYVGYSERTPLHQLSQTPWLVLLFSGLQSCHPQVLQLLTQALRDGCFVDGSGKPIFLSDAIVLLTAALETEWARPLGFGAGSASTAPDLRDLVAHQLGDELDGVIDQVAQLDRATGEQVERWLRQGVLQALTEQYRARGFDLEWAASLVNWLLSRQDDCHSARDWERLLEQEVLAVLVPQLTEARGSTNLRLGGRIERIDDQIEMFLL